MGEYLKKLWVKETLVDDPTYVDIFESLRKSNIFREAVVEQVASHDKKDNSLADQYRQDGNKLVQQKDYKAAIEQYNKSLCFAENDSLTLSLGYANRAFCFLTLELYDECLNDIRLAQKANYPVDLMPKLEQRKLNCLQQMETANKRTPFEPHLNFAADHKISCMANSLELIRNEEFGRHFVAQRDIHEDQVVVIEEPLVKLIDVDSNYKRCHSCLKETTNVIPCTKCTKAVFCSESCSSDKYHHNDCNMKLLKFFDGTTGRLAQNCVKFLLRAVQIVLETFQSIEELIDFVELFRADSSPNDIIIADGSAEAMLGIFLTHSHLVPYEIGQIKIFIISCIAYDFLMAQSHLKFEFTTKKSQRFLMHLLTHFAQMFLANNILLQDWCEKWFNVIEHDGKETFGVALYNISSYFNHACMPNVIRLTTTNHTVIKTIRPIKQGEQICLRYGIDPHWSTPHRRQHLSIFCGFQCNCTLCLCNGPMLTDDPVVTAEFGNLSMEMGPLIFLGVKDENKWKLLKGKLFKFVKKYDFMPVSKNIILAYEFIRMVLTRELSCSTKL